MAKKNKGVVSSVKGSVIQLITAIIVISFLIAILYRFNWDIFSALIWVAEWVWSFLQWIWNFILKLAGTIAGNDSFKTITQ